MSKVLFISEKDAANVELGRIAAEFKRRGYDVEVFAPFYDENVLRPFKGVIKKSITSLTKEDVDSSEMIFCATLSALYFPEYMFTVKKPIYTYNYLINRQINWGGDVCFCPAYNVIRSDYEGMMNNSFVGIGDPKYDNIRKTNKKHNRITFIDSGHYPFSDIGKRAIAQMILDCCHTFSDMELYVKPRFLENDAIHTHENKVHLYNVIRDVSGGKIPTNLVLPSRHVDLDKAISMSDTVICMYTTAFVSALVAGKGLIVLDDVPSEDVYDIREKTFIRIRDCIKESNALTSVRDVIKVLPDGKRAGQSYVDSLLEESEGVARKIVDVCEFLNKNYFKKGCIPHKYVANYKNYVETVKEQPLYSWEDRISDRCHDFVFFKSMSLMDFHMLATPDIEYVEKKIRQLYSIDGTINRDGFHLFWQDKNIIRDSCVIRMSKVLCEDYIDAGILLNSYYLRKHYDEIRNFPRRDVSAFNLFRALIAVEDDEYDKNATARKQLIEFYSKTYDRQYIKEITDMSGNRQKATDLAKQLNISDRPIIVQK